LLPDLSILAVFLVATIALNLSPGPDMLYVISRSLGQGRRAGIVSALGIGAGTLVHTFVTAIGLSAVLLSVPIAFEFIKYAGAAYLAFLGVRMLLSSRSGASNLSSEAIAPSGLGTVFRQGVFTNVLNPKVALFFLAFLPQFVDPSKGTVAFQIILLGLVFDASGTSWNILIATLAGHASDRLKGRSGVSFAQKVLPGVILLALAILVVVR
jgi:threonine/homoserine/homoserine lactone efflux protein